MLLACRLVRGVGMSVEPQEKAGWISLGGTAWRRPSTSVRLRCGSWARRRRRDETRRCSNAGFQSRQFSFHQEKCMVSEWILKLLFQNLKVNKISKTASEISSVTFYFRIVIVRGWVV